MKILTDMEKCLWYTDERAKQAVKTVHITVISYTEKDEFAIYFQVYYFPFSPNECGRQRGEEVGIQPQQMSTYKTCILAVTGLKWATT